jgi:hypothetical protein
MHSKSLFVIITGAVLVLLTNAYSVAWLSSLWSDQALSQDFNRLFVFGRVLSSFATITAMWYIDNFWAILQKALQTRDAASVAAAEALQEASAAESVLRSLR